MKLDFSVTEFRLNSLYSGVFALAVTAVALFVTLLLRPLLDPNYFLPFVGGVLICSWYYGIASGLAATVFSSAAVLFFFLPPEPGFAMRDLNVAVRLGSFVALAVTISLLAAARRSSQMLLSATLSSIGDGVIATDQSGRISFLNPVAAELTGWTQAEATGKHFSEVFRVTGEDGKTDVPNPLEKALAEGVLVRGTDHVNLVSRSGNLVAIEHSVAPVRDQKGAPRGGVLIFRDVSARRHLEEQLTQSQKMDAVGRLAGGVAGDFNNVLTVITGYSELLRAEIPAGNPLHRYADEIMWAAERPAGLTRQLLAFSRGPAAQPRLIDLNVVLGNMEPMLRRLLGDDIELITLPGPALGRVKGDPAQIEQAIVNLASNARDAMTQGGKLVIETANVELDEAASRKVGVKPGSYVMLAVSDTGVGMDPQTRSRLFEPFFTTKESGKGSGLGLSTVYGIVRQSEGQITVYSQPDCGTIFEIYLPHMTEALPAAGPRRRAQPSGSETILLVDDEEGVRKLVNAILQSHGYTVIEASGGPAALSAFEKNAHKIDLVLTDVVMPQMNGFELGERLGQASPDLRILYMSGYRDNPIGGQERGPRPFLHKPFTPDTLLEKVREVLDAQGA